MKLSSIRAACLLVAATLTTLLSGCASEPRVGVVSDPGADFSRFTTFGFHQPLGTDREGGTVTVLSQTLMRTARAELESLGYVYTPDKPDLEVNFFVETREVLRGRSGPGFGVGYGVYHRHYGVWSGYETEISQYTESTLHVDIIDAGSNQMIWEGVSTQRLKGHDLVFETEHVGVSLAKIFEPFPPRQ
jgi:hypothetical protein